MTTDESGNPIMCNECPMPAECLKTGCTKHFVEYGENVIPEGHSTSCELRDPDGRGMSNLPLSCDCGFTPSGEVNEIPK